MEFLQPQENANLNQMQQRFRALTPDEVELIAACAKRAGAYVRDIKMRSPRGHLMLDPDLSVIYMDFATAHVNRRLKLRQLLLTTDADFIFEFATITQVMQGRPGDGKNDNRACMHFPADVHLSYAEN